MRLNSFIEQATTSIDSKGRTAFPREFRKQMSEEDGDKVVIAPGPQQSLVLYTVPEWNKFMDELARRPQTQANSTFITQIKSFAHVCELDAQNRISITPLLQRHAQLQSEVLFAARQGNSLGMWNPERFEQLYGLKTPTALEAFDAGFWSAEPAEGRH